MNKLEPIKLPGNPNSKPDLRHSDTRPLKNRRYGRKAGFMKSTIHPKGRLKTISKLGLFGLSLLTLNACNTSPVIDQNSSNPTQTRTMAIQYVAPEANGQGKSAWLGGLVAWLGGKAAWLGGKAAWLGGDTSITLAENYDAWKQVHLDDAQGLAKKLGAGVKVAVIDTGVDYTHPAFQGRLANASEWRDFVDNDKDPQEVGVGGVDAGFGHGTGVAGVIAQVAPKAIILPIRVLGPNGSGDATVVAKAIKYAVSVGAQVINLSLGTVGFDCDLQTTLSQDVPEGVFVVMSAGNNGTTNIPYPAATSRYSPNQYYVADLVLKAQVQACGVTSSRSDALTNRTVGVGSVSTINFDHKSSFSTYGKYLEMLAPGEGIYTAVPGGLLGSWSGTSFAAPMVSGALALAAAETLKSTVSMPMLARYVSISADNIDAANPEYAGLDYLGLGRLNINAFLKKTIVPQ
jgi:thermitase